MNCREPFGMNAVIAFLEGVHVLPADVKLLLHQMTERMEFRKKERVLEPGQMCSHLYYIEKGLLACYDGEGGKTYCTWLMFEKDIATAVDSFNNRVPSTEFIVAVEDSTLWSLSRENLEELSYRSTEFARVRQQLTDHYHTQSRNMEAHCKRTPEEYYFYLVKVYGDKLDRVPNHILASYMGIVESTLYKIKKERRHYR